MSRSPFFCRHRPLDHLPCTPRDATTNTWKSSPPSQPRKIRSPHQCARRSQSTRRLSHVVYPHSPPPRMCVAPIASPHGLGEACRITRFASAAKPGRNGLRRHGRQRDARWGAWALVQVDCRNIGLNRTCPVAHTRNLHDSALWKFI